MSSVQHSRQYVASHSQKSQDVYQQASYDHSFDSVRYPSNASQPSLSHSVLTHTESTPSSVCRPDFGDYPPNSDCETTFVSEMPASYDDDSDVDQLPPPAISKPSLKFVEPVVQRDHVNGQQRLTGMKKKMHCNKKANAPKDGEFETHSLPVLGFTDARNSYASEEGLEHDTLKFPSVPPREAYATQKQEQWNVDSIDIALEDLVLNKQNLASQQAVNSSTPKPQLVRQAPAVHSVLDEFEQDEKEVMHQPRVRTISEAKRTQPRPTFDAPLPPLPTHASSTGQPSSTLSPSGLVAAAQPAPHSTKNSTVVDQPRYSPEDEDNVFAFQPPSISGHGDSQPPATRGSWDLRSAGKRVDSMASSNHSSLREMDPRLVIERARMQPMTYGLDAEVSEAVGLGEECSSSSASERGLDGVHAEDLPPLLSNHYLQSKEFSVIGQAEYERLNRIPERVKANAAAAAAAAGEGHRLSHKHLSKHKKGAGVSSTASHYESISILRAEAAFLQVDTKKDKKDKKKSLWPSQSSSSSVASSRSQTSSALGHSGFNTSASDISSVSGGPQQLKSFKSSIRLKGFK